MYLLFPFFENEILLIKDAENLVEGMMNVGGVNVNLQQINTICIHGRHLKELTSIVHSHLWAITRSMKSAKHSPTTDPSVRFSKAFVTRLQEMMICEASNTMCWTVSELNAL